MNRTLTLIAALALAAATAPALLRAADAKPKYTIKQVMKALHKGDVNAGTRVLDGHATKEDIAQLVEYYGSLPQNDPPRGEKASWNEKTGALVKAAQALKSGEAGALDAYKKAANCKACHTAHKPMKRN